MKASARPSGLRVAVVGGGWAGLTAAVRAQQAGCQVTLFEASRQWGGRARTLPLVQAHGAATPGLPLDNGQHILIGAYTATLQLLQELGVELSQALERLPLALRFPDGGGLVMPRWAQRAPAALGLLAASLTAQGWSWRDKLAWLRTGHQWQTQGFTCAPQLTVAQLCAELPPRVIQDLLDPLCVAALNTPLAQADAATFLRVLRDALHGPGWGHYRASDLLLPRTDLGALLPNHAVTWLHNNGATLQPSTRVTTLDLTDDGRWHLNGTTGHEHLFDHVVLACPAQEAARLVRSSLSDAAATDWASLAERLTHTAIATVYMEAEPGWRWPVRHPMLALRSGQAGAPAQFVFHRGQTPLAQERLAWVASACEGTAAELEQRILHQARRELGLNAPHVLQTVVEKRATFACVPGLERPVAHIAPGLWAAGDYVAGPYPATLEGAVRSGEQAVQQLLANK